VTTLVQGSLDERLGRLFRSDPASMKEPYELLNELRETAPVHDFELGVLVSSYDGVQSVMRDSVNYGHNPFGKTPLAPLTPEQEEAAEELSRHEALGVNQSDGEDHERLRRIVHRAFTPRRMAQMTDSVERYTNEMLEPMATDEPVELMDFAYLMPLMVIGDLLGLPPADRDTIHEWTGRIGRAMTGTVDPEPLFDARDAVREFRGYIDALLEDRRGAPAASDLSAALMDAEQDERLSPDELSANYMLLLFAGHETTTNLISHGLLALLRNRDQWQELCADPDLSQNATEELLRYVSPVQWHGRYALKDTEIEGLAVPAGRRIFPMLAGANRDPAVFADPDRLDIRRHNSNQHLAFGFGPHYCLGQALARLEGQIVFATLARRFPDMQAAVDEPVYTGSSLLRRLASLEVVLGPDRDAAR
jgi:cytochrome P450